MTKQIIAQGAEALLIRQKDKLIKKRIKKSYRLQEIDEKLRKRRTKAEAKLLDKTANLINVPVVEKTTKYEIIMQFIDGKVLSEWLDKFSLAKALKICKKIGKSIAILHSKDIIHADLTTSNMILQKEKVFFIDFGLSYHSSRIEDRAVDLHLLKQALQARHFSHADQYFGAVINEYKKNYGMAKEVLLQLKKVEQRGRYKRKIQKRKKRKNES